MAGPLKPLFFVTRADGTMVPLLAVDELPNDIKFEGIKSQLTPHDIGGMIGIGTHKCRGRVHELVKAAVPLPSTNTSLGPPDRSLSASRYATTSERVMPRPVLSPDARPRAYGIDEQPPTDVKIDGEEALDMNTKALKIESKKPASLPVWHMNAGVVLNTAPGVKEYCSYWLRNGECDYAQQGCIYRHEMPLDHLTLARLGLLDIPRWYREKYNLASLRAVDNLARAPAGPNYGRGRRPRIGGNTPPRQAQTVKTRGKISMSENCVGGLRPTTQARLLLGSPSSPLRTNQTLVSRPQVVVPQSATKLCTSISSEAKKTEVDINHITVTDSTQAHARLSSLEVSPQQKCLDRFYFGDRIRFKVVTPAKQDTTPPPAKDSSEDEGDNEMSSQASTKSPITSASDVESNLTIQSAIGSMSLPDLACTGVCCVDTESELERNAQAATVKMPTIADASMIQEQVDEVTQMSASTDLPLVAATSQVSDLPTVTAKPLPTPQTEVPAVSYPTGPSHPRRLPKRRNDTRGRRNPRRAEQPNNVAANQRPPTGTQRGQHVMAKEVKQDLLLDI